MSLQIGDITASSGLAKRIYDNLLTNSAACGFGASPSDAAKTMLKAQSYCFAKAIVEEITANAVVSGTTSTTVSAGGLQKYYNTTTGLNSDTAAPDAPVALSGTATGTVT